MELILYAGAFMCTSNKVNKSNCIKVKAEVDVFSMKFINGHCEIKDLGVLYILLLLLKLFTL